MLRKEILIRSVTRKECPWLEQDLPKGKQVFKFTGHTYGCISKGGVAVSDEPGAHPFYEVPADALPKETGNE